MKGPAGRAALACAALLALGLCAGFASANDDSVELGTALETVLFQMDRDPFAKQDSFALIPEAHRSFWARDTGGSMADKAQELKKIEITLGVEIKLVGFDGEGNKGVKLREVARPTAG